MSPDEGPVYTSGTSYRARAEARQRRERVALGAACARYGHLLTTAAARDGKNFVSGESFSAARTRRDAGKGVAWRTFDNMLSSQAMAFNIFAPLNARLDLAARSLEGFIPGLASVNSITIEHTPAADVFGDQTGLGGVDCDLLIEGINTRGEQLLCVIETKFVETEFSVCGFRKPGRARKQLDVCPDDVAVQASRDRCLYERKKGYAYWQRSDEHALLAEGAVPDVGCPFAGPHWQLWVNLALAHEEAKRRGSTDVRFAVCTSPRNNALLEGGKVLTDFQQLLRRKERVHFIDLDALLARLDALAPAELKSWSAALCARYANI